MALRDPKLPRPHHTGKVYRVLQMWHALQHIFRCWRDFPDLRFMQFLTNAIPVGKNAYYVTDFNLELYCYRYWVKHSGKIKKPEQEAKLIALCDEALAENGR